MKKLIALIITVVFVSCKHELVVDMPEEHPLISRQSSTPDTLISWISGDTIHFRFLIAARNFPEFNH